MNAAQIADDIVEDAIKALRRDPRFQHVSRAEIELILADVQRDAAEQIERAVKDAFDVIDNALDEARGEIAL